MSTEDLKICGTRPQRLVLSTLAFAVRVPKEGKIDPQSASVTNIHAAPELLQKQPFDGSAVDLWPSGMCLLFMLLGPNYLFNAPVPEDANFNEICIQGNLTGAMKRIGCDTKLSESVIDLLHSLLRVKPEDRLSLNDIKAHPWVTDGKIEAPVREAQATIPKGLGRR